MNATEKETTVQRILVPLHRTTPDYVYEKCEAARIARYHDGATVKISPLKYFNNGDRLVEVTVEDTRKAGVPKVVLAEAEAQFRRAREVARVAVESYREARDKVTQLRKRRRSFEVREAQRASRTAAAQQGHERPGYRSDTATGEPGPTSEV